LRKYLEKISLNLEEERTLTATGMLRITSQRTLDTDEGLHACFIDWQKAFDHVNWAKLMQIPRETGINSAKENYQQIVHGSEC
jgi:hypothetical protein